MSLYLCITKFAFCYKFSVLRIKRRIMWVLIYNFKISLVDFKWESRVPKATTDILKLCLFLSTVQNRVGRCNSLYFKILLQYSKRQTDLKICVPLSGL